MPPEKHSDNSEEMNDRIRRFLNSIPKNEGDDFENEPPMRNKKKVKDILIMTGIETFTKKYPQIQKTELFQTTMDEMLVHYTKFSKSNRCDIDDDNLTYMLNYFELFEEYEKCKVIFDML
jgi:hypothetical protein